MDVKKLTEELKRDEGCILHEYKDSLGFSTLGIGRLIDKKKGGGITQEEAEFLLANDIQRTVMNIDKRIPWFITLPDDVQRALANMCFQMGIDGLLAFKTTLKCIQMGDYKGAAFNARKSKWYGQTPNRAERVCKLLENAK